MESGEQWPLERQCVPPRHLINDLPTFKPPIPHLPAKIALFYFIFYVSLAILVAICMWTFLQLLDDRKPMWQLDKSIIGTNPGLGFRPMPSEEASSIIRYRGNDPGSYKAWVEKLAHFLKCEL